MGAGHILLAFSILFGDGGWGHPGKVQSVSSSITDSSSLSVRSTHRLVKTVYDTVCNETSTRPTQSTSLDVSSTLASTATDQSSNHGSPIGTTLSPSNAQSASGNGYTSSSTSQPLIVEQSSTASYKAQSAASSLISVSYTSLNSYSSHNISTIISSGTSSLASVTRASNSSSAFISSSMWKSQTSQSQVSSSQSLTSTRSTSPISSGTSNLSRSSTLEATTRAASQGTNNLSSAISKSGTFTVLSTSASSKTISTIVSLKSVTVSSSLSRTSRSSTAKITTRTSSSLTIFSSSTTSPTISKSWSSGSMSVSSIPTAANTNSTSYNPLASEIRPSKVPNRIPTGDLSAVAAKETAKLADCNDGTWDLTTANYMKANTDANLKIWWNGGADNETGISFPPKSAPGTFLTEAMAASFEPVGEQFLCTLEQHSCQPADGCANYAVHIPSGVDQVGIAKYFHEVGPASHYGWFAIHSIANIYAFAESFTAGLTAAGIQIASENLQLTKTFTKPQNQDIKMRTMLLGFSFLVAVFFAFVPIIGEAMGAAVTAAIMGATAGVISSTLRATGGFIGLSLASGASLDTNAATFGAYMGMIFNSTAGAVDQMVSQLMNGIPLNAAPGSADPTLFNMLEGGKWINSSIAKNPNLSITTMTEVMRDDLISRGINYIWLQSKIWVTFANLHDDAAMTLCLADRNGWQASKTCADGGVYYLYRFNEDGDMIGHLDYPWGADQMTKDPFGLNPNWVTRSSAASYRAQNNGIGGFNYDQTKAPANLTDALTSVATTGTLDSLRVLPGVWNLSVCDMGDHNDWNADFTAHPPTTLNTDGLDFFFPCCCGPGCAQTHDWIQAAQMENFKTIVASCRRQLTLCKAWPPGVTEIDYGQAGKINNRDCVPGDTMPDWVGGGWEN